MKIKELHIADFGKFHDYTLTFENGLNCLYGQNEDGKTTLMTFLRMMFYGSSVHGSDLIKNPRKRYFPFSGRKMAGSVNFTHEGISYRLERTFAASNTTDQLVLFDLTHGEQENSTEPEIGKRFFGMSADAFERTYFVGQFGAPESNPAAEGELNSRLSGLVETGEDGISFELLNTRLTAAKDDLLAPKHVKGRLDKAKATLESLNEQLLLSQRAESEKQSLSIKVANEKDRLASAQKEYDRLENQLSQAENWRNAKKLNDYLESRERSDALQRKLKKIDGTPVTDEELDRAEHLLLAAKAAEDQLNEWNETKQRLKEQISQTPQPDVPDTTEAAAKAVEQAQETVLQRSNAVDNLNDSLTATASKALGWLIPAIVCLVFGAGVAAAPFYMPFLGLISTLPPVLYYGIGGGLALLSVVLWVISHRCVKGQAALKQQIREATQALDTARDDLSKKQSELTEAQTVLKLTKQNRQQALERLQTDREQLEATQLAIDTALGKIEAARSYCCALLKGCTPQTSLSGLEIVLASYKESARKLEDVTTRISLLTVDLGQDITPVRAKAMLQEVDQANNAYGDPGAIKEMMAFKSKEIAATQKDLAIDEANLKTAFLMHRHPTELEHEIATLKEKINDMQNYWQALDFAQAQLSSAFGSVRESFGQALDQKAGEIFNRLTGGTWNGMTVSRNFELSVNRADDFGSKSWQYLSAGTTDQAYLSLRMAIAELLSGEGEGAPLFLDDTLLQFDETREELALQYLQEYAANRQVLLFSCRRFPDRFAMQSLRKEKRNS